MRRLVHKHWPGVQAPQSMLVLLDLKTPVLDGFGFLQRFQHLPASYQQAAAVIVCSSSTNAQDLARVKPLAHGHLPKPPTAANLKQLLCQHLPAAITT